MPQDAPLFDLNALGETGVQLAQLAAQSEAAGVVETLTGTVIARKPDGQTLTLTEGSEIFMGDTIEVSDAGSVGFIFADETTLSLGENAELVIDEMVYDANAESGSLVVTMANGMFSFVSGQISKTADEAFQINTPIATIGIRGTKGAGVAGEEGSQNQITLMPEDDGQVGELVVRNEAGVQVLNQAGQTLAFSSQFETLPVPQLLSPDQIDNAYAQALNVLPPPPRNRGDAASGAPTQGDAEGENQGDLPLENLPSDDEAVEAQENEQAPAEGAFEENELAEEELEPLEPLFSEVGGTLGAEPAIGGEGDDLIAGGSDDDLFGPVGGSSVSEGASFGFGDIGLTDPNELIDALALDETLEEEVIDVVEVEEEDPLLQEEPEEDPVEDPSLNQITGTSGLEQIFGTNGDDDILGGLGDDYIAGGGGADIIHGDDPNASVGGHDVIYGDDPVLGRASTQPFGGFGLEISGGGDLNQNDYTLTDNFDYVVFETPTDIDTVNDTNGFGDVYLRKLGDATTPDNDALQLISGKADGTSANSAIFNAQLSGNGQYVFFETNATDLSVSSAGMFNQIYRYRISDQTLEKVSVDSDGVTEGNLNSGSYSVSSDGNLIVFSTQSTFPGSFDSNGNEDIYLKNMSSGTLTLVSKNIALSDGGDADSSAPVISDDGAYIVYSSGATDLISPSSSALADIYLYDVANDTTTLITEDTGGGATDGASSEVGISSNGNYVVFASSATDLIATDGNGVQDIFLYDKSASTITLVSEDQFNMQTNGSSFNPSVSDDGRYVVFRSVADNLSPADPNGSTEDIFVKDMTTGAVRAINKPLSEDVLSTTLGNPYISADGSSIIFSSGASLVPGKSTANLDVFIAENPFNTGASGADDMIDGGEGNDTIWGGGGNDVLTGGQGNDVFYFRASDGADTITDFTTGVDKISIDGASYGLEIVTFDSLAFAYDGTNASPMSNVIKDVNGDVFVDVNDTAAGGYSLVANVGAATTVAAGDVEFAD